VPRHLYFVGEPWHADAAAVEQTHHERGRGHTLVEATQRHRFLADHHHGGVAHGREERRPGYLEHHRGLARRADARAEEGHAGGALADHVLEAIADASMSL